VNLRSCHWRLKLHRWVFVTNCGFRDLTRCERCGLYSLVDCSQNGDVFRDVISDEQATKLRLESVQKGGLVV
jgi:hypothetical protein